MGNLLCEFYIRCCVVSSSLIHAVVVVVVVDQFLLFASYDGYSSSCHVFILQQDYLPVIKIFNNVEASFGKQQL